MMNTGLFTCLFFVPFLLFSCAVDPIESSLTTEEVNIHPLLGRELDSIEQLFPNITRLNDNPFLVTQYTTQESQTNVVEATTSEPLVVTEETLPRLLVEETLNDKKNVSVNHRERVPQSSSVFVAPIAPNPQNRLFYVSDPVYGFQYGQRNRPLSRKIPLHFRSIGRENSSPFRPFESGPIQPKHLGFPPISNTRENLGKQINWNAKVGRAHRSFYDYMMA